MRERGGVERKRIMDKKEEVLGEVDREKIKKNRNKLFVNIYMP